MAVNIMSRKMLLVINQCLNSCHLYPCLTKASFKSRSSLDTVYPSSNLDITASPKVPQSEDKFSGFIPIDELMITYSTSSGPGGQNVNKVHTKVDLRFEVSTAKWIPETVRPKLLEKYYRLINKDGCLVLKSERTRSQMLNVADCLDKLRFMIRSAESTTSPPSQDSITLNLRRHEKACRERLRVKRMRSALKESRRDPTIDD